MNLLPKKLIGNSYSLSVTPIANWTLMLNT
jgi:hypothetical protein